MSERYGMVIGIKPEFIEEYERLHANVWPGVLAVIEQCNIRNYSIYRHGETLFAHFEYVGRDFDGDMARMAAAPETQRWWDVCKPLQQPLSAPPPEGWWTPMTEIFHTG